MTIIGMTRMRAVELGVPVIHAAVTGRSTFVDVNGQIGEKTGLGTEEILDGLYRSATVTTPYTTIGDSVLYAAALLAVLMWWRTRSLVGSGPMQSGSVDAEEE